MRDDEIHLLDQAIAAGMINEKQAGMIRSELQMFPGQNAGRMLVRRHLITDDQLARLKAGPGEAAPPPANAAPPPPPAPAAAALPRPAAAQFTAQPPRPVLAAQPPIMGQPPRPAPVAPPPPAPMSAPASKISIEGVKLDTAWDMLAAARQWGCSDLHLCVGVAPFVRKYGEIHYLGLPVLTPERSAQLNFSLLDEEQLKTTKDRLQIDLALDIPGVGRHRCNIYRQRLGWDGAFRIIPNEIRPFEEIGLPASVRTLTDYHNGLIIVAGPGGSGKTTTSAAMLDLVNKARQDHIITVEDPVEYILPPAGCQVSQRQVGLHTQSFAHALKAALREDPDIILVGEMRDLETIQIAISASETGHLVFGTLHTNSATRTVSRIMDVFPPEQREQISAMVSKSMRGIICQQLIPRKDGTGMALALEILIFNSGVSALIREGKNHLLASAMQSGKRVGMKLMDDSLMELFQHGAISGRDAYLRSENKPLFDPIKEK